MGKATGKMKKRVVKIGLKEGIIKSEVVKNIIE